MATPEKTKEEILAEMDAEAILAREEFRRIRANSNKATFEAIQGLIAEWWKKWYPSAGHKRLAYILMDKKLKGD